MLNLPESIPWALDSWACKTEWAGMRTYARRRVPLINHRNTSGMLDWDCRVRDGQQQDQVGFRSRIMSR